MILSIGLFSSFIGFYHAISISFIYTKLLNLDLKNDHGLLISLNANNILKCLDSCNKIKHCVFVLFDSEKNCRLFDQNAENGTLIKSDDESFVWKKKLNLYNESGFGSSSTHLSTSNSILFDKEKFLSKIESQGITVILDLSSKNIVTSYSNSSFFSLISIWNTTSFSLIKSSVYGFAISCLFEFSNSYLITGLNNGKIVIWNLLNLNVIKEFVLNSEKHSGRVTSIIDLKDGRFASSSSFDKTIRIWDTMQHISIINAHDSNINTLIDLEGGLFASGSDDNTINVWYKSNFSLVRTINQPSQVRSLIKLNKTDLILALKKMEVKILDLITWSEKKTINFVQQIFSAIVFLERKYLAVGLNDGSLEIFETSNFNQFLTTKNDTRLIYSIQYLSNFNSISICFEASFIYECNLLSLSSYF
ncbi:unnamed protein product [Brachionus calyciflorus]|uniref:Uncharacterized protein n=1 Tax=Brachionus calyciflorus TaxID=104777 RepID=A0A814G6S2_9BILA|nr:unnamed protein product [Brachionus calyciflorus]